MAEAIRTEKLGKVYAAHGRRTVALTDVDLTVPSGIIYGLIGRNGAGKTTFIRITSTQLMPTSGRVTVLGHDAVEDPREVRSRIAVIPQESRPLYFLNVDELVYLYLKVRGMESAEARRRTDAILEELGLTSRRKTVVSYLSGGMRRRAMVAMVLASDAEVLYLDEPTTGLDPLARREVWSAIRRASREHRTVLLTTHYLDEAEALSLVSRSSRAASSARKGARRTSEHGFSYPSGSTSPGAVGRSELEPYGKVSEIEGGHSSSRGKATRASSRCVR